MLLSLERSTWPFELTLQRHLTDWNKWKKLDWHYNRIQKSFLMPILIIQAIFKSSIRVHLIPWQVTFPIHQDLQGTCNPTDLLWANSSSAEHLAWLDCSSVNCFWSLSLVSFNILSFSAFSVLYKVKASFNWECKHRRVTKVRDFTSYKDNGLDMDRKILPLIFILPVLMQL